MQPSEKKNGPTPKEQPIRRRMHTFRKVLLGYLFVAGVFLAAMIVVLFLIIGPMRNSSNVSVEKPIAQSSPLQGSDNVSVTESPQPKPVLTSDQLQAEQVWKTLGIESAEELMHRPSFEKLNELTFDQLLRLYKHTSPIVRWYCAYRIVEFDSPDNHEAVMEALGSMRTDQDELVTRAAAFSYALLTKDTAKDDRFIASPDGRAYAFVKYNEANYNDGVVWITKNGVISKAYWGGVWFIYGLSWSPDSKWLCVRYGGRTWNTIVRVNSSTGEAYELSDIYQQITADPSNGYIIDANVIGRFDQSVSIVEWSSDSKRFLFRYDLSDESNHGYSGFAVYNLVSDKVERMYKLDYDSSASRPENFSWD